MRLYRRIGNYAFTALLVLLTRVKITDGQTGMRAFSREAADRAEIVHDYNYAQVLTLDLLRKGFRMEEVEVRYRLREHGQSFNGWSYPANIRADTSATRTSPETAPTSGRTKCSSVRSATTTPRSTIHLGKTPVPS